MTHCYILLIFFLLISLICGRAVYYDQLDEDENPKSLLNDDEGKMDKRIFLIY
jgi:hypothetical protein